MNGSQQKIEAHEICQRLVFFKVHHEKVTMNDMTVANISKSTLPMYKIQYKHLTCPSLKTHQFAHYLDQVQSCITVFSQTKITTVIQTHCNITAPIDRVFIILSRICLFILQVLKIKVH